MTRSRQTSSRGPGYRLRGIHGRVVSSIGEGIIKGRYPPGSLLPREPELIAKFEVSRTALREALKVLAAKGLVETRQRVGTRVRPQEQWNHFDPEITAWQLGNGFRSGFVRDLIEFRQILETTFKLHQATKGARSYGFVEDVSFHRRVFEKIGRRQPEAAAKAMSRLVAAAEHDLTAARARRRPKG